MSYQAAIFDLDGTLIDSLEDLADSANAMLTHYGFPTHPVEPYRYFVGNGSRKLLERCLPADKGADAAFVDEALAYYKECYAQRILNKTQPYDGIMAMLQGLQQRGIPMGICTNKHQSAADAIVGKLFPDIPFVENFGDRPGNPRTPDPQKPLQIAKEMGVAPAQVAYFGDTSVDMDTAHNAGFYACGVLWGFRPREELVEHGAQILLAQPADILQQIDFGA